MKLLVGLLLLLLCASANADSFYTVVGFQCDAANDALLLTYDGANSMAGEDLVRNKQQDQWDLWSLYRHNQSVRKQCRLSDGEYELSITTYHTGSCYDCFGIWAKVTNGAKLIFDAGLDGYEGPPTQMVISRAVIKSHGEPPELTHVTWEDFIFHTRPEK